MERIIELLEEIYDLTLRQEKAINLGLVPRFMRLLQEKQEKIEEMDKIDIEKSIDKIPDENTRNKVTELIRNINDLNSKNIEGLKLQKKELKKELDKLVNAKKVLNETYAKQTDVYGQYIDNKN